MTDVTNLSRGSGLRGMPTDWSCGKGFNLFLRVFVCIIWASAFFFQIISWVQLIFLFLLTILSVWDDYVSSSWRHLWNWSDEWEAWFLLIRVFAWFWALILNQIQWKHLHIRLLNIWISFFHVFFALLINLGTSGHFTNFDILHYRL